MALDFLPSFCHAPSSCCDYPDWLYFFPSTTVPLCSLHHPFLFLYHLFHHYYPLFFVHRSSCDPHRHRNWFLLRPHYLYYSTACFQKTRASAKSCLSEAFRSRISICRWHLEI